MLVPKRVRFDFFIQFTCSSSLFQDEIMAFRKLNKSVCKQVIFSTIKKFLSYAENNFNYDVYDISLTFKDNFRVVYKLFLNSTKTNEIVLCNKLRKFQQFDYQILMLNVAVHIGRKIMKANNPELDIFVFDFNKAKSKNK